MRADVRPRRGKILVLLALMLPAVLGVVGLVVDGSRLMTEAGSIQHLADAGVVAAASALARGESHFVAEQRAIDCIRTHHGDGNVSIEVDIPPTEGAYAGRSGYVQVRLLQQMPVVFGAALGGTMHRTVRAAAVAGLEASTSGAAIVVLDPNPPGLQLPTILGLTLPPVNVHHLGGLELLGLGRLKVDGAVLVNTDWGGEDEHGDPAGPQYLLKNSVTCMPLLPLTKLRAKDVRVVGGVDNFRNFGPFNAGGDPPLKCNMRPVPDPLANLPIPTVAADPTNVKSTLRGGVTIIGIPLIGPPTVLRPGVYEYIQIVTGRVIFEKGVYIIRGRNPLTGFALELIGGEVNADGVMFYITDNGSFSPTSGLPDAGETSNRPPASGVLPLPISAVVNAGLLGSRMRPLNDPASPFDGMLFYQRRNDRRIMVIVRDTLLGANELSGTIYSKWGHLILVGMGKFDTRFVVGSFRFINVLESSIEPTRHLPAAQDVYLVD